VGLLLVAGRFIQRLDETCKRWGITDDQYNVLRILSGSRPDGQPRFAIAQKLINPAPDVTRLLDRLEAKRLVVRDKTGPDRRQVISYITPEGLALLSAMSEDITRANQDVTQTLSSKEKEVFRSLIRCLVADGAAEHGS